MKRRVALIALCVAIVGTSSTTVAPAATKKPAWLTQWLRSQLQASGVPVLLPQPPPDVGPIRSVPVINVGRNGYYVGFSTVPNCGGANSCATFFVAGSPAEPSGAHAASRYRPIRLDDGTRAMYAPDDCSGASCTGGSLIVERNGFDYELDARLANDDFPLLERAYHTLRPIR